MEVSIDIKELKKRNDEIAKELAAAIAIEGNKMKVGDPTKADTEVGPLIKPAEVDRV